MPATSLQVEGRPVLVDRGFSHIPAAAFRPGTTEDNLIIPDDEYLFLDGFVLGRAGLCSRVVAPVHLPDGVTVDSVWLTAIDKSSAALELYLMRVLFSQADSTPLAMSVISTDLDVDALGLWLDTTIEEPVINNASYHYYLVACPNRSKWIRSVLIFYSD